MSRRPPSPEQEADGQELRRRAAAVNSAQDALDTFVRHLYNDRRYSQPWIGEQLGGVPQQTISLVVHERGRTPTDRLPKETTN